MMKADSKGFIYTLEAILGSALLLGVVLAVIPEIQQEPSLSPQRQVHSGLETLDRTGNLTDNLSSAEIESELDAYTPDGYNHSVSIIEVEEVSENISSPHQRFVNGSGNSSELQIWADSAGSLNVSFDGEKVLENYSGSGYELVALPGTEGWLNFTGTGELEYSFNTYSSSGGGVQSGSVSVTSYLVHKNGTKEVRVSLWQ